MSRANAEVSQNYRWRFPMNRSIRCALFTICSLAVLGNAPTPPKQIGILVFDGFLTSDVTAPVEVFGAATKRAQFSSYRVVIISATRNREVRSEEGLKIVADQTIYDAPALDVLLVPSAYKMDPLLKNADLVQFITRQRRSASWMASNCSGAFLLGAAGVLDGKNATTGPGEKRTSRQPIPRSRFSMTKM